MKRILCILIVLGLSAFTEAQDKPQAQADTEAAAPETRDQPSSAPSSSSSPVTTPPRPAPRAFKPSEEVRADTVLSLPADI